MDGMFVNIICVNTSLLVLYSEGNIRAQEWWVLGARKNLYMGCGWGTFYISFKNTLKK